MKASIRFTVCICNVLLSVCNAKKPAMGLAQQDGNLEVIKSEFNTLARFKPQRAIIQKYAAKLDELRERPVRQDDRIYEFKVSQMYDKFRIESKNKVERFRYLTTNEMIRVKKMIDPEGDNERTNNTRKSFRTSRRHDVIGAHDPNPPCKTERALEQCTATVFRKTSEEIDACARKYLKLAVAVTRTWYNMSALVPVKANQSVVELMHSCYQKPDLVGKSTCYGLLAVTAEVQYRQADSMFRLSKARASMVPELLALRFKTCEGHALKLFWSTIDAVAYNLYSCLINNPSTSFYRRVAEPENCDPHGKYILTDSGTTSVQPGLWTSPSKPGVNPKAKLTDTMFLGGRTVVTKTPKKKGKK